MSDLVRKIRENTVKTGISLTTSTISPFFRTSKFFKIIKIFKVVYDIYHKLFYSIKL